MKLRGFNESGIEGFDRFRGSSVLILDDLRQLLEDTACTVSLGVDIQVEPRELPTRFAVGEYLYGLFENNPVSGLDSDKGIWAWLSAFHFEQLRPPSGRLGERARWVPDVGNYQNYYRHLLAGPYQIYRAHRDDPQRAMALLVNPPYRPGDIAEQLASRQEYVTNNSVMEVATLLYVNEDGAPKRGAAGRGPGSARRLADILNQLDLTWDLYSLTPSKLLELLPSEFDQFKP